MVQAAKSLVIDWADAHTFGNPDYFVGFVMAVHKGEQSI